MSVLVREGTIDEAIKVQYQIPEFDDAYNKDQYLHRLKDKAHLILIATLNDELVGFKTGYALDKKIFYSWMGGILPEYREQGIAKKLALYQENWAQAKGFSTIRFKTRNYLKSMLIFSLKNGFNITETEKKHYAPDEYRIILEKEL